MTGGRGIFHHQHGRQPAGDQWLEPQRKRGGKPHSCKVAFQEDGTYTFRDGGYGSGGQQAVSEGTDTFTIDGTRPELQVSWEGPEARNGSYYPAERRARIQVRELNFDPGRVRIEAAAAEGETPIPSVWQSNGELHTAFVSFGKDGRYALAVSAQIWPEMRWNPTKRRSS